MAKNNKPQKTMPRAIGGEMIGAVCLRGRSLITSRVGGNEAKAIAAKVSIMRFTQSICVTVNGIWVPIMAPPSTKSRAVRLITSWKKRKRRMLL